MPKPVFRLLPASAGSPLLRTGLLLMPVLITTNPLQADSQPLNSPSALPALNIDLNQTSVSGISSGGFMAVQLHAAHASQIVGVGVFAGGPYQCAGVGNQLTGVGMALNVCMSGDADAEASLQRLADAFRNHLIDDPQQQRGDRVWLYSGYNDGVVKQPTMNALDQYYQQLTLPGLVYYKSNDDAGHAQITDNAQAQDCVLNGGDFINNCDYDGAGLLLQHIYGSLTPRTDGALKGHTQAFDQSPWASSETGMAATAYLFVPADCERGETCRLHIAFHGCLQNAETIGDRFYRSAGYNQWADNNRLVVLYPQTTNSNGVRFNPKGCWDWWGYSDPLALQADYASRNSPQIRAVWNMASQLASAYRAPQPPAQSAPPAQLLLTAADSSDRMIALHWPTTTNGRYNLYRSRSATGPFERLNGDQPLQNGSFSDRGLQARSRYFYKLEQLDPAQAVIATSTIVSRSTGAPPAICDPWFGTIDEHLLTGRAYNSYMTWSVRVTGSEERLGSLWGDGDVPVTLQRTAAGHYRVGNCPAN